MDKTTNPHHEPWQGRVEDDALPWTGPAALEMPATAERVWRALRTPG